MATTNTAVSCGHRDVDLQDEARRYRLAVEAIGL
jgi:hypothetical protein